MAAPLTKGSEDATDQPAAQAPTDTVAALDTTPVQPVTTKTEPVDLDAVGGFDPEGDGNENDVQAVNAVDGNLKSAWETETYRDFFKSGIGLLVDAGRVVPFATVTVRSTTPGFVAEVRVGNREEGPFRSASASRTVGRKTVFRIRGLSGRFVVLWMSGFEQGSISIEEISATRRA